MSNCYRPALDAAELQNSESLDQQQQNLTSNRSHGMLQPGVDNSGNSQFFGGEELSDEFYSLAPVSRQEIEYFGSGQTILEQHHASHHWTPIAQPRDSYYGSTSQINNNSWPNSFNIQTTYPGYLSHAEPTYIPQSHSSDPTLVGADIGQEGASRGAIRDTGIASTGTFEDLHSLHSRRQAEFVNNESQTAFESEQYSHRDFHYPPQSQTLKIIQDDQSFSSPSYSATLPGPSCDEFELTNRSFELMPTQPVQEHDARDDDGANNWKCTCSRGKDVSFGGDPKYVSWTNQFPTWVSARPHLKKPNWMPPQSDDTIPRTDEEARVWVQRLHAAIMDGSHVHDNVNASGKNNHLIRALYTQQEIELACWKAVHIAIKLHTEGATLPRVADPTLDKKATASGHGAPSSRKEAHRFTFAARMAHVCYWARCEKAFATDIIGGVNIRQAIYDPKARGLSKSSNKKQNNRKRELLEAGRSVEGDEDDDKEMEDGDDIGEDKKMA